MDFKRVLKLARFRMVHILDDITGFQPAAVANKNDYIKCIARYLFENVSCSSNICKQQNPGGLGCDVILK